MKDSRYGTPKLTKCPVRNWNQQRAKHRPQACNTSGPRGGGAGLSRLEAEPSFRFPASLYLFSCRSAWSRKFARGVLYTSGRELAFLVPMWEPLGRFIGLWVLPEVELGWAGAGSRGGMEGRVRCPRVFESPRSWRWETLGAALGDVISSWCCCFRVCAFGVWGFLDSRWCVRSLAGCGGKLLVRETFAVCRYAVVQFCRGFSRCVCCLTCAFRSLPTWEMTSLAQQLRRLALPQSDASLLSRNEVASLLFDPKEAGTIDRDTLFAIGELPLNLEKSLGSVCYPDVAVFSDPLS